jgi:hypothetical protein
VSESKIAHQTTGATVPNYQVTYIFDLPGHGFTESWWVTDSRTNLDELRDTAMTVARARMGLASEQCTLQAIRISNGAEDGKIGKTYYEPLGGVAGKGGMASNVAINCQFGTQNNDYQKLVQIRGAWDEWEVTGGALDKGNPQLRSAFGTYVAAIQQARYGWRSIVSRQTFDITNYEVVDGSYVVLQLAQVTTPLGAVGNRRVARISKLNTKSVLNGEQVIRVSGLNTVTLEKPTAAGPFVAPGQLIVPSYGYRVSANGSLQRLGKRQAGAPLLRSPGRRSARARV